MKQVHTVRVLALIAMAFLAEASPCHAQARARGLAAANVIAQSMLNGSESASTAEATEVNGLKRRLKVDDIEVRLLSLDDSSVESAAPSEKSVEWLSAELRRQFTEHGRFYIEDPSGEEDQSNFPKPSRLKVVIVNHGSSRLDLAALRGFLERLQKPSDEESRESEAGGTEHGSQVNAQEESEGHDAPEAPQRAPGKPRKSILDRWLPKPRGAQAGIGMLTSFIVLDVQLYDPKDRRVKSFRVAGVGKAVTVGGVRTGNPEMNAAREATAQVVRDVHAAMASIPWEAAVDAEGEHDGQAALICDGGQLLGVKQGDVFQLMRPVRKGRVAVNRGLVRVVDVQMDQFTVVPVREHEKVEFEEGDFVRCLLASKQ